MIDRNKNLVKINSGNHRFMISRILRLKKIPIEIKVIHLDNFKIDVNQKIKIKDINDLISDVAKNMPKLIEVIGLPGSGKSFISSELETIKKNNEQIFFHSGNYNKNNKYKSINVSLRFLIHLKVISKIIIFI